MKLPRVDLQGHPLSHNSFYQWLNNIKIIYLSLMRPTQDAAFEICVPQVPLLFFSRGTLLNYKEIATNYDKTLLINV